jgi:hypothetical protein
MTSTFARLLQGTRALESRLATAFERTAQAVAGHEAPSALELVDRVGDELVRHVQPSGRGRYTCPFDQLGLTVVAPTMEDRARLDAVCAGPPSLRERLLARLESAGCGDPELDVSVDYVAAAESGWPRHDFHLALTRGGRPPSEATGASVRIDVRVTHGTADRGVYSFSTLPICLGRGGEVRDQRLQLVRVNHVAFADEDDDVNRSVSRRHARIELDAVTGRPRIFDDGSAQGTSVLRGGRGLAVPRGSRGLGLQSDDEVVLGQARLRVRISTPDGVAGSGAGRSPRND